MWFWTHPSFSLGPTAQFGLQAGLAHPELGQWQHLHKSKFAAFACTLCPGLLGPSVTSGTAEISDTHFSMCACQCSCVFVSTDSSREGLESSPQSMAATSC